MVALTKAKRFLNSASHSPWVVRQVALTKAKRFPMGRVNSAKRFLRKRFRVNQLRLRTICCIMFPVCNLLTRAESPAGCLWQAGFAPVFLCRTHVNLVWPAQCCYGTR
ncbi:hypothetical protein MAL08_06490 [Leptospira noguchii]|uniref:hypothetical protein n=1 Tax=Leptospira noguchii TaxID=28182 RepID=UPI001FB6B8B1|nr:hypothetical protein [Leptospira noguchii]UOG38929.1 hypothetical protein MAL08_06490 [Leptospira noguchii]